MNDLYTVEQPEGAMNGNRVSVLIRLNPLHEIFIGHFPGDPMLPGVCIIQILKEILMDKLGEVLIFSNIGSIKFFSVINPGVNRLLHFDAELKETGNECTSFSTVVYFDSVVYCRLKGEFRLNLYSSKRTSF